MYRLYIINQSKTKMANAWITHLKKVHKSLPNGTSLKHAMKTAKKTYKKIAKNVNKKHRGTRHRRHKKRRGGEGEDMGMGEKDLNSVV